MRVKTLLVAVLAIILSGSCHAAPWQKFTSIKGDFTVLMPGKPVEEKEIEKTGSGPVTSYTFTYESPLSTGPWFYIVGYTELTDEATLVASKELLDEFRAGLLEDKKSKLLGERNIMHKAYAGRLIKYRDTDGVVHTTRAYVAQRRMYYVMTATIREEEKMSVPAIEKFFNSFEILGKRPAAPPQPLMWRKFSPPGGGFAILMPGTPTSQQSAATGSSNQAGVHTFTLVRDAVVYVTAHRQFRDGTGWDDPAKALTGFRAGMLSTGKNSRLLSEKTIALHEFPGREIKHTDSTGLIYTTRAYVVRNYLYVISAATPTAKQSASSAAIDKFLDSFELLGKPPETTMGQPA